MAFAAVPEYLGQDFRDASPGMRFGMYLKLWGENRRTKEKLWETHDIDYEIKGRDAREREVKRENKGPALDDARKLNNNDKEISKNLFERQKHAFDVSIQTSASMRLEARSVAPFTTGLGHEHPLENGFAFLSPYGLPYLPGSGVKGVSRQAARELASGLWNDESDSGKSIDPNTPKWTDEPRHILEIAGQRMELSDIEVLFGRESDHSDLQHLRGCLTFWDVFPQLKGDSLMVDIMTPHHGHYYQNKGTPHDSGSPNPIAFLTVPPESNFVFHVQCDTQRLEAIAPDLAHNEHWKALIQMAFEHSFAWLGFGAKTSVGYGAMEEDPNAAKRRQKAESERNEAANREAEQKARALARETMSPSDRYIDELLANRTDKTWSDFTTLFKAFKDGRVSTEHRGAVASRLQDLMKAAKKWKPKTEKKNPAKDNDYQDTLTVQKWLTGN